MAWIAERLLFISNMEVNVLITQKKTKVYIVLEYRLNDQNDVFFSFSLWI